MLGELDAAMARDPAAKSRVVVALGYPGVHAVWAYRVTHRLWLGGWRGLARLGSQLARAVTGVEIHPGASIGQGLFIDHGMGVVIGETAEIGNGVTLYQGVTLGGTSLSEGKRHPTLGDGVVVGAGAKLLGPIRIGARSKVGANAVVVESVEDDCVVVGIPARVIRRGGVVVVGESGAELVGGVGSDWDYSI
jgi:serine O-acetyltransferase